MQKVLQFHNALNFFLQKINTCCKLINLTLCDDYVTNSIHDFYKNVSENRPVISLSHRRIVHVIATIIH